MVRAAGSYPAGRWFESDRRYQLTNMTRASVEYSRQKFCHRPRPLGQAVKTPPFHGGNMGSIPVGVTKKKTRPKWACFLFAILKDSRTLWVRSTSVGRQPFCRYATFPLTGESPVGVTKIKDRLSTCLLFST